MRFRLNTEKGCRFHKESGNITVEASTAGINKGYEVIDLISHRTGKVISCTYSHREMDRAGEDLLATIYKPVGNEAPFSSLVVYND